MEMFTKIAGIIVVVVGVIVLGGAAIVGVVTFFGMLIMLTFGFLHGSISEAVPAYGFYVSCGLALVLAFVLAILAKLRR